MKHAPLFAVALAGTLALVGLPLSSAWAQSAPAHRMAGLRPARRAEQSFPAQPSVAAKSAKFATVSAASPEVRRALPASDLAAAGKMIGKPAAVQGTVAELYSPRDHDIAILDFAKDYKSALTAIVKPANYSKLPSLQSLVGKHVLVTGIFSTYQGRPQVEITSLAQVKIIR